MHEQWGIAFGVQTPPVTNTTKLVNPITFKKISLQNTPIEIFSKLYKKFENVYLLESIEGPKKLNQFSFVGFGPTVTIPAKNGKAVTRRDRTCEENTETVKAPLSTIRRSANCRTTANKDYRMARKPLDSADFVSVIVCPLQ